MADMLGTLGTVDSIFTYLHACVRCLAELQLLQTFLGDFEEGVLTFSFVTPTLSISVTVVSYPFLLPDLCYRIFNFN